MSFPGFWQNETSGLLAPVVRRYLNGANLYAAEIKIMKMYLRQWIYAPQWAPGEYLDELRRRVDLIDSQRDIDIWTNQATNEGLDPF